MATRKPIIGIISAGEMGSAVAARLTARGARVLTDLSGRSQATKTRASAGGMEECSLRDIVKQADWLLSIVPPSDAERLAKAFISTAEENPRIEAEGWRPPVYVDCNAKNPESTLCLAKLFTASSCTDLLFLNACIIGLPPKGNHDPTFYASASSESRNQQALRDFDKLSEVGLRTRTLCGEGSDICDASSLKMTFSGIMKGMIAIWETMILSAHVHSPATSRVLLTEMQNSLPQDLLHIDKYVVQAHPKAYRFVREMEEMSSFVYDCLGDGSTVGLEGTATTSAPAQIFGGFAAQYARIAESHRGRGNVHADGQSDIDVLNAFVDGAIEGRLNAQVRN